MRALVVAYYFPPLGGGGVNRTLKLVRGMADAGWEPVVLTVDDAAWVRDPALLDAVPARARVVRVPNPDWGRVARWRDRRAATGIPAAAPGAAGRLRRWLVPDLCVGWSALAAPLAAGLARTGRVDAVYTTCPPYSAHAAGLASRALGAPWVADFRDAWTDCPTRADLPRWREPLERALEQRVWRTADRVLFASEGARQGALRRAPELCGRSEMVLTGFEPSEFAAAAGVAPQRGRLELVHAGSVALMNRGAVLERFLSALAAWAEMDPRVPERVRVRFVGAEPSVASAARRAGVSAWVRSEPAVARERLPALLAGAHVCLVLGSGAAGGTDPIPGKVFDAAGAGRPLLALTPDGALARLVRRRGLGAVIEPEDSRGLRRLLADHFERALRGVPLPGPPEDARWALSSERAVAQILAALEQARRDAGSRRRRGGARRRGTWAFPSAS